MDIETHLRNYMDTGSDWTGPHGLFIQAADTIAALRKQVSDAVGALEEAAGTLEGLSYIHDGNPSDAMADMPAVEYARHMLYEARQLAKAAHSEARAALAAKPAVKDDEPVAVRELHGPYGWLNGHRALNEDSWELENDPLENSDEYFAIPLYALTDPFAEIGKDGPQSALVATPPAAMTCDEQFALATKLAGDLGYDLVPEPPHPDTPVDNFSGQTTPPAERVVEALREEYLNASKDAMELAGKLNAAEAREARLSEALRNVRRAIMEADPAVLTDTFWMPSNVFKGGTVVDFIDAALSGSGSGWRAMDTAPETGFFLAWSPDFPDMVSCWKAEIFHQARKPGTPRHLSANHFTLWRPLDLPAAPQQGGE